MSALPKSSEEMTVAEFYDWSEATPGRWELVDGQPVGMAPVSTTHSALQCDIGRLIATVLERQGAPCSAFTEPGVIPHVSANTNVRVPDLAVMCGDYKTERAALTEPVVVIEILSPRNKYKTWSNVWAYATIPSVKEIAVFYTESVGVKLLRRLPNGEWPKEPELIESGDFALGSIGVSFPLAAAYRTTRLG